MTKYRIIQERDRQFVVQYRPVSWLPIWIEAGSPMWPSVNTHSTRQEAEAFIEQHSTGIWSERYLSSRKRVVAHVNRRR